MSTGVKRPISPKVKSLQEQLRRERGIRELHRRFLIVCEDTKSAPSYFEAVKRHENLSAASIAVVGSGGRTQPIQVVKEAIERSKASESEDSGTEPFQEVWCIIDGDYGSEIGNARSAANAHGVRLAISNQCFEYWVLLHFTDYGSPLQDCGETVVVLKSKFLPNYTKGGCDYSAVVPFVRQASERAGRLRKPNLLPEEQNPCSDVYLLIDAILGSITPRVQ